MDQPRSCGCKGCRTCILCESQFEIKPKEFLSHFKTQDQYVFCPECNALYKGWDVIEVVQQHPNHNLETGIPFTGVYVQPNFITAEEESKLMKGIDEMPWQISQSGRRKQNFGPKTNFKKQKLVVGGFHGFPEFSKFVQTKLQSVPLLQTFQTIEQCSLEYDPSKGASIDPHIDDCWIWGERVVTVNCLSDSVLTLSLYKGDQKRYNLELVNDYKSTLISGLVDDVDLQKKYANIVVRVPMPKCSLIVLYGSARYQWEHCVLREDILSRRVCIAYREFTPPYLNSNSGININAIAAERGASVLSQAKLFWNHSIESITA